jgi:hypothetical protein
VATVTYREGSEHDRVQNLALSHLSVEVGHFYMEELTDGEERIKAQFCKLEPFLELARATVGHGRSTPRVSTCFLLDDYFRPNTNPREIVEKVDRISRECGVRIDYMVREAGCRKAGDIHLAELTAGMLAPEPAPGTNGSRPPAQESGWLSNGERSPLPGPTQAMRTPPRSPAEEWTPPVEFGRRNHSIFMDVEMWKELEKVPTRDGGLDDAPGKWACPFLAAVWHLLRLGMVRYEGRPVLEPVACPSGDDWPDSWDYVPPIIQLTKDAAPFAAYRSTSIMPATYLPIEHASRMIIDHLVLDEAVIDQVVARAAGEGVQISRSATRRMSHLFVEGEEP